MGTRVFDRLAAQCKAWGGQLELCSKNRFESYVAGWYKDGFSASPSAEGHGIFWHEKRVVATEPVANAGTLIHEMGHCFLDPTPPSSHDEGDWLGWEIALARRMRCYRIWDAQNAPYVVNEPDTDWGDWGTLSRKQQRELSAERIAYAQSIGIIDKSGKPLARR